MISDDPAIERMSVSDWPTKANRWIQVTFVENDPEHFDSDFWLGLMKNSAANAICISAGGYIAYYPTNIPFHYRSSYLQDTDPFGILAEGARSLDMTVMARLDPHAIHSDAAEAHPEWLARDISGNPIPHWSFPGVWLTCPHSSYHREVVTDIAREIVREYEVDAIFANRWEGHGGISYSESAQRSFRDATGFDLPVRDDQPNDPVWQAYVDWRQRELSELVTIWDDAVREIRPQSRFIPNVGGRVVRDMPPELIEKHYPVFYIDKQGRSGIEAPWVAGRNGKINRGMYRDRPVGLITSVGPEHHHRWKDSVASPAETKMWMVDGMAQGAFPWFTKFNATISDDRWVKPIVEAFALHEQLENVLVDLPIVADVALLDATQTDRYLSPAERRNRFSHDDGFYQALVEAGIPFEYIADRRLSSEELSRFKVLVLSNAECLSDEQCAVISDWVKAGGNLVAAHQSSLFNEHGHQRDNFGLADVLGVDLQAAARGSVKNNYIELMEQHVLHAGLEGAKRIIGGTAILSVHAGVDTDVPYRFIPDFPDLPMEEVYPRENADDPAVVTRTVPGGGRTAYIAFNIGSIFWEALQPDHGTLIVNAVTWALGGQPSANVSGPGMVDIAVRRGDSEIAIALVNLSNPMTMRGAMREYLPSAPQVVEVQIPEGANNLTGRLLVGGTDIEVAHLDGKSTIEIPPFSLMEVVHLVWT